MKRAAGMFGFLAVFLFLAAWPVLAQEHETPPAETPTGYIFRWLNFAIVFGGIAYVAVKMGGPYFRAQAEETAQKIAEGARATRGCRTPEKGNRAETGGTGRRDQENACGSEARCGRGSKAAARSGTF